MFRDIVAASIEAYLACKTGKDRSQIVQSAIDRVHALGGRFLRKHQLSGKVSSRANRKLSVFE